MRYLLWFSHFTEILYHRHFSEEESEVGHKLVPEPGIHRPAQVLWTSERYRFELLMKGNRHGQGWGKSFNSLLSPPCNPWKKRHRTKEECTFSTPNSLQPSDEVPQKLSSHQSWRDRIGRAQRRNEWLKRTAETKELFYAEKPQIWGKALLFILSHKRYGVPPVKVMHDYTIWKNYSSN